MMGIIHYFYWKNYLERIVMQSLKISINYKKALHRHASKKHAALTEMVSSCIYQISDVVQTNSATAEESAAVSEELYGQSQLLKNRVSRFKLYANH